eukprot:754167-Hanusia_phi.AAC.3
MRDLQRGRRKEGRMGNGDGMKEGEYSGGGRKRSSKESRSAEAWRTRRERWGGGGGESVGEEKKLMCDRRPYESQNGWKGFLRRELRILIFSTPRRRKERSSQLFSLLSSTSVIFGLIWVDVRHSVMETMIKM